MQGVIWDVNSYDQWGVELGKALAKPLIEMVAGRAPVAGKDSSTTGLIGAIHGLGMEPYT